MNTVRLAQKIRPRIEREMRASAYEGEHANEAAFQEAVDAAVSDEVSEAEYAAACDRAEMGISEDSPCIQSADLWGTGEGRYHGVLA